MSANFKPQWIAATSRGFLAIAWLSCLNWQLGICNIWKYSCEVLRYYYWQYWTFMLKDFVLEEGRLCPRRFCQGIVSGITGMFRGILSVTQYSIPHRRGTPFYSINILQSCVAKHFRCSEVFSDYVIVNLGMSVPVREFWKPVNACWIYDENLVVYFLDHPVVYPEVLRCDFWYTVTFRIVLKLRSLAQFVENAYCCRYILWAERCWLGNRDLFHKLTYYSAFRRLCGLATCICHSRVITQIFQRVHHYRTTYTTLENRNSTARFPLRVTYMVAEIFLAYVY